MARRRPWRLPGLANEGRSEAQPGRTSNGPPTARAGSSEAQPGRTSNGPPTARAGSSEAQPGRTSTGPPTARARLAEPEMSLLDGLHTRVVVAASSGREAVSRAAPAKE